MCNEHHFHVCACVWAHLERGRCICCCCHAPNGTDDDSAALFAATQDHAHRRCQGRCQGECLTPTSLACLAGKGGCRRGAPGCRRTPSARTRPAVIPTTHGTPRMDAPPRARRQLHGRHALHSLIPRSVCEGGRRGCGPRCRQRGRG